MHLPDKDLAGLGSSEAALPRRRKASSVPRIATGWMRRILADVWSLDLKVVEADFTLVGVNPALDRFTDLARRLRQEAEEQAHRHGPRACALRTTSDPGFVTSDQWKSAPRRATLGW